jgi:hypothetical protein
MSTPGQSGAKRLGLREERDRRAAPDLRLQSSLRIYWWHGRPARVSDLKNHGRGARATKRPQSRSWTCRSTESILNPERGEIRALSNTLSPTTRPISTSAFSTPGPSGANKRGSREPRNRRAAPDLRPRSSRLRSSESALNPGRRIFRWGRHSCLPESASVGHSCRHRADSNRLTQDRNVLHSSIWTDKNVCPTEATPEERKI